jgi:hypothetical protein
MYQHVSAKISSTDKLFLLVADAVFTLNRVYEWVIVLTHDQRMACVKQLLVRPVTQDYSEVMGRPITLILYWKYTVHADSFPKVYY